MRRPLRTICRALAAALALWAALWAATGDNLAPVRAGLYVAPFLLALAMATTLAGLALRDPAAAATAALVAALIAAALPPSFVRLAGPGGADGITLTTLSNRTLNTDMAATAAALRRQPADILVLQEIAEPARLTALLSGLYRAGAPPGACTNGSYLILSRFPVGAATRLPGNAAVRCQVDLPAGPVAVYAVHLPRALADHWRQRDAARTLAIDAARQGMPVVLAGDFNATPLTATMRLVARDLINAFDRSGHGAGFTFPTPARRLGALGPFLRIDHVLLSPALAPVHAQAARWHPPGADHYPVEVVFTDTRTGG